MRDRALCDFDPWLADHVRNLGPMPAEINAHR
jgi:hypothetical protein